MFCRTISSLVIVAAFCVANTSTADAGPLLDWLRSKCSRNDNVVVGGYQATSGTYTQAPTTLMPGQCQRTCMQTCQRTVVNYVPYTAYRTEWQRVPVTQYRPVTNTDPCSGCTVTCMRPCTNYSWQLQRKPYTTYRPVYQTQSYRVPVTTITNDCNSGCSTCGVPAAATAAPAAGGFVQSPSAVPADNAPVLSQRPYYGVYDTYQVPGNYQSYQVPTTTIPSAQVIPQSYSSASAYSGISQYSGYGTTNSYSPPMPSSYSAPLPGSSSDAINSPSTTPADQTPILRNNTPASSGDMQSVLGDSQEARPLTDPSPDMRWDFNVPPLGRSEDQSAMNAVQVRWAYSPVNGATYSDAFPAASTPTQPASDVNQLWESTGESNEVNAIWN